MTTFVPAALVLNPTTPDYVGTYNALQADLLASPTGSWNALAVASTGSTIIRWIASVSAFAQGSIGRALQECYLDTARSPSGILRAVRLQGAHIIRRRSGSVNVTISRTDNNPTPLVVPTLTQWLIGGQPFYNNSPITMQATGASVNAVLLRGLVTSAVVNSNGNAYQLYVLGTTNTWTISDDDVWMTDSTNAVWEAITTGLWQQNSGQTTFFESTLPDGTVECKFGDGNYGTIPPIGTLSFTYIQLDSASNTATSPTIGTVGNATNFTVVATTTSNATANLDYPPPDFYKAVGPGQAANNQRAVTRDDHRAIALKYPGVIDALFRGQAELNPSDPRWMNVIAATLLTSALWSEEQWIEFKQYFESDVTIATTSMVRFDPISVPINVTLNVAANSNANIASLTTLVTQVITSYFAASNTSLGFTFQPSDLIIAIMESATYLQAPGESGSFVDYIQITAPLGPVVLSPTSYFVLNTLTPNVFYTTRGLSAAATGQILGL